MAHVSRLSNMDTVPSFAEMVCVLGVFDGLHEGHQMLLAKARGEAQEGTHRIALITFDIDPDELFGSPDFRKILSNEERISLLAEQAVDEVVVLPFEGIVSEMAPEAFLDALFVNGAPRTLLVGQGFRFGKNAAGSFYDLASWAHGVGAKAMEVDLLRQSSLGEGGTFEPVSSTAVRQLLASGKMRDAARLLGRPYSFAGEVLEGRGEGEQMGFRTANMHIPATEKVLGDGVYAGYALVGEKRYKAAISVGLSPTFEGRATANLEVHLLGFDDDIYGKTITIEFIEWLRPLKRFDDVDELIRTVQANIAWIEEHLSC